MTINRKQNAGHKSIERHMIILQLGYILHIFNALGLFQLNIFLTNDQILYKNIRNTYMRKEKIFMKITDFCQIFLSTFFKN